MRKCIFLVGFCLIAPLSFSQMNRNKPVKSKRIELSESRLKLVNRQFGDGAEKESGTVSLSAGEGAGVAIVSSGRIGEGTIRIDLRGENNPGRSFVGIAFNVQNDSTYEAIYFRPFNFIAKGESRRQHSIQYVSLPQYDWAILRKEREGKFEAAFDSPPDPDSWFSININIRPDRVIVKDPKTGRTLLNAERLAKSTSRKIGLWVGNGSKGSFKNLSVSNK